MYSTTLSRPLQLSFENFYFCRKRPFERFFIPFLRREISDGISRTLPRHKRDRSRDDERTNKNEQSELNNPLLTHRLIIQPMVSYHRDIMEQAEALAQNPQSPAPREVLEAQRLIDVEHYGFDGAIHQGQIVAHESAVRDVERFFALARETRFPIEKVIPISHPTYHWDDEFSCVDNNSSGFNYRLKTGSKTELSNHARGLAFDINPVQNIYVRFDKNLKEFFRFPPTAVYDPTASGTLTANHPLVALMKGLGWRWGGDWTPVNGPVDYQHFEKNTQ